MNLHNFIGNYLEPFAYAIYFAALLIYCRTYGWYKGRYLLIYYALVTLLMTYASLIVGNGNNNWIYHVSGICIQSAVGLHFYSALESRIKKQTIIFLIASYSLYAFVKYFILGDIALFDSIGYSLVSAFTCIIMFMYFHQLLKHVSDVDILRQFNFWLASGYLIYFLGSFIIFVSYYYLTTKILTTYTKSERALMTALWGLHNVLLFIGAFSLLIGSIWITYRRKSA